MHSAQTKSQRPAPIDGPGTFSVTLESRHDMRRVVTMRAENRKDATLKAEEQNPGFYMVATCMLQHAEGM